MRYRIVIFDGGVEEIVIWAASVDVGDLNVTSIYQLGSLKSRRVS